MTGGIVIPPPSLPGRSLERRRRFHGEIAIFWCSHRIHWISQTNPGGRGNLCVGRRHRKRGYKGCRIAGWIDNLDLSISCILEIRPREMLLLIPSSCSTSPCRSITTDIGAQIVASIHRYDSKHISWRMIRKRIINDTNLSDWLQSKFS